MHFLNTLNTCFKVTIPLHGNVMKVLNVAEKNDAAKRIAAMLSNGNSSRREGFSKFNKIYEFNYNVLNNNCKMVMTSMSGHLMNYEFAGSYRMWTGCHPMSLFEADVHKQVNPDMLQIKKTLEKEIRGSQMLIIWTDCDREGENIGYEVINICQAVKPNISVYRAKFSEITSRSVQRALSNLVSPDQNVSDAVDVRQELDLRVGASFTRYQTMRLNKVFPEFLSDKLISYGPCQFPTLGFVVERFKARENFISEPFWKLEVEDNKDGCRAVFNWKRGRLFDESFVEVLYDECIEPPCIAMVTNITSKPKSKWRPVAMDTVEMEKLATRKLRISASAAMKTAEKLYSKGFISYPRTETNIFPKDIDLNRLISEQVGDGNWGNFAQNLLEIGPTPRNGTKSDKAHPPIHPLKPATGLTPEEYKLYELVTRHFLACCHRDAKGHETTVEIDLAGEKFTAQGLMILEKNYLEVYTYENWNAKTIPVYQQGYEFEPTRVSKVDGQTTAPALLSEADLIALMDKHGIGTDATHAEHIETLKKRLYIGVTSDRRLVPGELGMGLINGLLYVLWSVASAQRPLVCTPMKVLLINSYHRKTLIN